MPTYALLGATGATGSAILRTLIASSPENLSLNILVRSKQKLSQAFPTLSSTPFPVQIFEGTATDTTTIQECIAPADIIFVCTATNSASRDVSIAQDTANSILTSLHTVKSSSSSPPRNKPPTVILLRSASCNPTLRALSPWSSSVAEFCFYYIYVDLKHACSLYESASPRLLQYVYIDPPSLHDADGATPTGYEIVGMGDEDVKRFGGMISYSDLGAAFCEVAERVGRGERGNEALGVWGTGEIKATVEVLMGYAAKGAKSRVWG